MSQDKKYLIVPGPMQIKGTDEKRHITAEALVQLYQVEMVDCHVYIDGKDLFKQFDRELLMLIPRYEREDYVVNKCFTIGKMIDAGFVKDKVVQ